MSLKSSNRARRPPGNPKLATAISRLEQSPGPERAAALRSRLMSAPLLIAVHDLPEAFASDPQAGVRFLTETRADGGRVVCGFSSHESLAAKAPTAVGLSIDPATLLDWLIASDCDGLLLDPAGPSAFVSHDDARELLGLPRRENARRRPAVRHANEKLLHDGLERLLAEGAGGRASVRETTTSKGLRFECGEGESLRLVLEAAALAADERERAEVLFEEFAGGVDDLPPLEGTPEVKPADDFVALFSGDLARPTRAGVKIFTWVFGFSPDCSLEIGLEAGQSTPSSS